MRKVINKQIFKMKRAKNHKIRERYTYVSKNAIDEIVCEKQ